MGAFEAAAPCFPRAFLDLFAFGGLSSVSGVMETVGAGGRMWNWGSGEGTGVWVRVRDVVKKAQARNRGHG